MDRLPLQVRDYLDFDQRVFREPCHFDRGASRRNGVVGGEVAAVDLIHGGEISNVLEEDSGFYHLGEACAGGGQHCLEVFDDSGCLLLYPTGYKSACGRIERDLA